MISVLDLARCCDAVYLNSPAVAGFNVNQRFMYNDSGFFAALFIKKSAGKKTAVLAIRGTDDLSSDLP